MVDLNIFSEQIKSLQQKNRYRSLTIANGLDFSSNDYLGLSSDVNIKNMIEEYFLNFNYVDIGSTGSRLLRGNHEEFENFEKEAKDFFGDHCLLFSNGYVANLSILQALPNYNDLIIFDEYVHASHHDGMKLSRAVKISFLHSNYDQLYDILRQKRSDFENIYIIVESVYSMDGDKADIDLLMKISSEFDCFLIIDEAHSSFVYGEGGKGLIPRRENNIISLHTLGKAMCVEGAFICAHKYIIDILINRARGFIYSTAPSPLLINLARKIFNHLQSQDEKRMLLQEYIAYACTINNKKENQSISQIQKFIVKKDDIALKMQKIMQSNGYDIRAIRPPTVPKDYSRLRISINLNISKNNIKDMFELLQYEYEKLI